MSAVRGLLATLGGAPKVTLAPITLTQNSVPELNKLSITASAFAAIPAGKDTYSSYTLSVLIPEGAPMRGLYPDGVIPGATAVYDPGTNLITIDKLDKGLQTDGTWYIGNDFVVTLTYVSTKGNTVSQTGTFKTTAEAQLPEKKFLEKGDWLEQWHSDPANPAWTTVDGKATQTGDSSNNSLDITVGVPEFLPGTSKPITAVKATMFITNPEAYIPSFPQYKTFETANWVLYDSVEVTTTGTGTLPGPLKNVRIDFINGIKWPYKAKVIVEYKTSDGQSVVGLPWYTYLDYLNPESGATQIFLAWPQSNL